MKESNDIGLLHEGFNNRIQQWRKHEPINLWFRSIKKGKKPLTQESTVNFFQGSGGILVFTVLITHNEARDRLKNVLCDQIKIIL